MCALLALWLYDVDALIGLNAGKVTGTTLFSWSRMYRPQSGYGSRYYYIIVSSQGPGVPNEFSRFAPGVLEMAMTLFETASGTVPNLRQCTVHYAGIGRYVVTDVETTN
jgi:hypothetical protein